MNCNITSMLQANMTREGDKLHHGNTLVEGSNLEKCWKECLDRSNFEEKKKNVVEFNKKSSRKKRGLAITPMKFAPSFFAGYPFQVKKKPVSISFRLMTDPS